MEGRGGGRHPRPGHLAAADHGHRPRHPARRHGRQPEHLGGLPRARLFPAGSVQQPCRPARQTVGEEGIRQALRVGSRPPLDRGGPAQRRGVPARPGLARQRGRRLPGAGDLAPTLRLRPRGHGPGTAEARSC
nr:hypothetical protein [Streptomyces nanshensis]